jgi:hypothetical protein
MTTELDTLLKRLDPLDDDAVIPAEHARRHLGAAMAAAPRHRRARPLWAAGAASLAGAAALALVLVGGGGSASIVERASAAVSDCKVLYTDTTWLTAGRTIEREQRWASCDGRRTRHRDYSPSGRLTNELVIAPGESTDWNVEAGTVSRFRIPRQPSAPRQAPPPGVVSLDGALDALAKGQVDEAGRQGELTVLHVRGSSMDVLVDGNGRPREVRNADMRLLITDLRRLGDDPSLLRSTAPSDVPVKTYGP